MARLLIFNPDHDYALQQEKGFFTPPRSIRILAELLETLPTVWANPNDKILLADNRIANFEGKNVRNFSSEDFDCITSIEPWGWNHSLKYRLLKLGFDEVLLPDDTYINEVRRLSHRRTSILANRHLNSSSLPVEFQTVSDAMMFAHENPGCYFKMPWSSGGRGILATAELSEIQIMEWLRGAIRRQGSVLAEKLIKRVMDFATLWFVAQEVEYRGVSVSLSDGRGKYDGNVCGSQEKLLDWIQSKTLSFTPQLIESQKCFLETHIRGRYRGFLGIDMAVDVDGLLYPCVEINLRRTMGHVALDISSLPLHRRSNLYNQLLSQFKFV